jgi:hypothetical protein
LAFGLSRVQEAGERSRIGDVERSAHHDGPGSGGQFGGCLRGQLAVEVADGDPRAGLREPVGGGAPDAAGAAGDGDNPVGETRCSGGHGSKTTAFTYKSVCIFMG